MLAFAGLVWPSWVMDDDIPVEWLSVEPRWSNLDFAPTGGMADEEAGNLD